MNIYKKELNSTVNEIKTVIIIAIMFVLVISCNNEQEGKPPGGNGNGTDIEFCPVDDDVKEITEGQFGCYSCPTYNKIFCNYVEIIGMGLLESAII